jgi:hypothetical protein
MRPLQLDFVEHRHWAWRWIAALVVCGLWAGSQAVAMLDAQRKLTRAEHALQEIQLRQTRREHELQQARAETEPVERRRQAEQLQVAAALRYPWPQVLNTIERSDSAELALLSFVHDRSVGKSALMVEALNFGALTSTVQELNENNGQGRWFIASYQSQFQIVPQTIRAKLSEK